MSGFHGTELDICLRDMGVKTVIPTGVSANMGIVAFGAFLFAFQERLILFQPLLTLSIAWTIAALGEKVPA